MIVCSIDGWITATSTEPAPAALAPPERVHAERERGHEQDQRAAAAPGQARRGPEREEPGERAFTATIRKDTA